VLGPEGEQHYKLNNHRHAISLYFTFYNWTLLSAKH